MSASVARTFVADATGGKTQVGVAMLINPQHVYQFMCRKCGIGKIL